MNIIRPGIPVSGFFFAANTSFYVNWVQFEKIVSRPAYLVRLTTNKL